MHKYLVAGLAGLVLACAPAQANTWIDPVGDFLPTMGGTPQNDLDVTSFTILYNAGTSLFTIKSTMAGTIDLNTGGFYVIGVNTGTPNGNFANIGLDKVVFDKLIFVRKTGNSTANGAANIINPVFSGASFSVDVPLAFLASTGFTPDYYGFNIWPRNGLGGVPGLTDFAPNNGTLAAVPEPASWALMIGGLALAGAALRRRRIAVAFA